MSMLVLRVKTRYGYGHSFVICMTSNVSGYIWPLIEIISLSPVIIGIDEFYRKI